MNINFKNFYKNLGLIQRSVQQADFLAIDFEFLGIDEKGIPYNISGSKYV